VIPRYLSREPVPVKKPVLAGDFPFSTAEAQSLETIGKVLDELARRKIDMQNKLGLSNIDAAMTNAELAYQADIQNTPLEKRPEVLRKHINTVWSALGQQRLTPEMRKLAENRVKIWAETSIAKASLQDIKELEKETTMRLSDDYMNALITGNPIKIQETELSLTSHLAKVMTPTEAKLYKEKLKQEALEQAAENAINEVHAAVEAASTTGDFSKAKELAKNDLIPETEQTALRRLIRIQEVEYNRKEEIQTNQLVKGDLEQKAYQISLGTVKEKDYEKMLYEARYGKVIKNKVKYVFGDVISDSPLIDDEAYDELRTLGTKQLKSSQAKGLADAYAYAKGQLVSVPSEQDFLTLISRLPDKKKKHLLTQRQIELENLSQFNQSMRDWRAEHPDAVESDYYIEARRKLPFYRSRTEESIMKGLPKEKVPTKDLSKLSDEELLRRIIK